MDNLDFHLMLLMMEWVVHTRKEVGIIQIFIVHLHLRIWDHRMEAEAGQEECTLKVTEDVEVIGVVDLAEVAQEMIENPISMKAMYPTVQWDIFLIVEDMEEEEEGQWDEVEEVVGVEEAMLDLHLTTLKRKLPGRRALLLKRLL